MDMMSTLSFLDEEYLSNFNKIEIDSHIDVQKPFTARKLIKDIYPIAPGEAKENKTFLSMNYSIATSLEKEKDVGIYCIRTCFIKK